MKPRAGPKPQPLKIRVLRLAHAHGLELPSYQSNGAAGMDLIAAIGAGNSIELPPGERALVPTGLALELPLGHEAQVRPRSGLAMRHGITVLNSPGTIDADYRGEVKVLLINLGSGSFKIKHGERIAQMVIAPVARASFEEVIALSPSMRGGGGFGSTGTAPRKPRKKKSKPVGKASKGSSARSRAKPAAKSSTKRPARKTPASPKRKIKKQ